MSLSNNLDIVHDDYNDDNDNDDDIDIYYGDVDDDDNFAEMNRIQ